ncbi:nicotinate (nicotinamide) nucleotide adenylyltransferase [candidate division KSB1 bacterium]|nr:nicotinate (nicotinamide) nucleotide adenylyltransferase [candidate division KSB1 bacterium]
MKIGIYGGTFDPIHIAHLIIAEYAYSDLSLEKLYFVPSYTPPHKRSKCITSHVHRLNMLKLAVEENSKFAISEFEINRQGPSFTVDTVQYFSAQYHLTRSDIYVLIGADNFNDFHTWKEPEKIVSLAQIVVAGRPNAGMLNSKICDFISLHSPLIDVSASMIRKRINQNKSVRYLMPEKVLQYIHLHSLYI